MNTQKLTGDMADQVEKDRDELIELRAVIAQCEWLLTYSRPKLDMGERRLNKWWLVRSDALAAIRKVNGTPSNKP